MQSVRTGRARTDSPDRTAQRAEARPAAQVAADAVGDRHAPVRPTLRVATAAAHHALDHHPLLRRLTASDLTREQYADALAAMHRPHAQLERLVHGSRHHAESGLNLGPRLDLLEADLRELRRPVPAAPRLLDAGSDDRAAWWGRVYVLEGSRLGGAFIATRVRSSLGTTVPSRFFAAAMASDAPAAMQAMRARELADPVELKRALASAVAAFAAYQAGLDASTQERTALAAGAAA